MIIIHICPVMIGDTSIIWATGSRICWHFKDHLNIYTGYEEQCYRIWLEECPFHKMSPIYERQQRSEARQVTACVKLKLNHTNFIYVSEVRGGKFKTLYISYTFSRRGYKFCIPISTPPQTPKKKKNNKTNHSSKCFHCISHGQKWRKNNEEHFSCFYRKWAQTIGTQSHFLNCQLLMLLLPYIMMRSIARPTAETETRVPMQYLIISYFAPSNWALIPWISCCQRNISESDSSKAAWNVKQETHSVNLIVQVGGFCTLICKLITCAPTLQSN